MMNADKGEEWRGYILTVVKVGKCEDSTTGYMQTGDFKMFMRLKRYENMELRGFRTGTARPTDGQKGPKVQNPSPET